MKIQYLIIFLICGMFAGQGWAPPPGQGGSPSKINMPKDQPGYEAIQKGKGSDKRSGPGLCCSGITCVSSKPSNKCTQILDRHGKAESCSGSPCR
jgi:hypothetical protein